MPPKINYFDLPLRLEGGMKRYLEYGIRPGDFLCSIIDNDLKETVYRADVDMIKVIPRIVHWFRDQVPLEAWGSEEKRLAWEQSGGYSTQENDGG